MRMLLLRTAVLVAIVTWFFSGDLTGQSTSKNLTGPAVTIEGMKSNTSSKWKDAKAEKPAMYKFILPKSSSKEPYDGEIVILKQEGKPDDVLAELKKKFTPMEGKNFEDKTQYKIEKAKVGGGNVTLMDIRGSYDEDGKSLEKYRMLAAVLEVKDKTYLIRALGPMNTVNFHRSDFLAWVASFK